MRIIYNVKRNIQMSKISNMLNNGKSYAINAVNCCGESEKFDPPDNDAGSMFSW